MRHPGICGAAKTTTEILDFVQNDGWGGDGGAIGRAPGYMSGFQPSGSIGARYLGLRPRLVYGGPSALGAEVERYLVAQPRGAEFSARAFGPWGGGADN